MYNIERSLVKRYFVGKKQIGPIITMIIGLITLIVGANSGGFAAGLGIAAIIAGVIWFLFNKFAVDTRAEAEVDKARALEISLAKQRAYQKLNIIDEQVKQVEPVVVSGRGFEPESPTTQILNVSKGIFGFFKKRLINKSDDPILMDRIGSDNTYRSSLISVTVFMFGDQQLYIYYSYVDLTTGLVYSEGTHEFFYSDICSLSFMQDREKVFNLRTKKYERYLFECVKVYSSGSNYTAHLSTDIDKSIIESQFAGMRSLIRDRKNSI